MSPGDGFADQRIGVSLDFLESTNYYKVVLPVYSFASGSCSTFLPAFDIIIFKYLTKIMGV